MKSVYRYHFLFLSSTHTDHLDINGLVGNQLPVQIPEVLVKWLTYALALHIVALILSAGSAVFGLLAHVREMAMTCCSIFISGFAAVVALLAFIFDISLFLVARSRINKVPGGSATIGSAIWLTFAAWVLLFFSGCFYTLGRCCISNRRSPKNDYSRGDGPVHVPGPTGGGYADRMRLDAIKAEADRKARQQQAEVGLPNFPESTPLKARIDGDEVYLLGDEESQGSQHTMNSLGGAPGYGRRPSQNDLGGGSGYGRRPSQNDLGGGGGYAGGYAQGPPGGRAIDQYYSSNNDPTSTYPPQPARKPSAPQSAYAQPNYAPSNYAQSNFVQSTYPNVPATAPVANTNYLASNQQYGTDRYASPDRYANGQDQYANGQDRYANLSQDYGHTAGGTTCELVY
jgi:SUR7/PalI family